MRSRTPIRAVLFDWDGTRLNSYRAHARAYLGMFRALGVRWSTKELERHYSPDWYRVYRAAGIQPRRWDEANRLWRSYYRRQKPPLLPGARRVLRGLARSFALGLVTSADRARLNRELRGFGLAPFFSARVCHEDVEKPKPHPESLRLALRRLGLPSDVCVYVGDAPEDIEMARRADVRAIAVLGPFPHPPPLAGRSGRRAPPLHRTSARPVQTLPVIPGGGSDPGGPLPAGAQARADSVTGETTFGCWFGSGFHPRAPR